MPAPTVEEKAGTAPVASKKEGTEPVVKPEDNTTAKGTATPDEKVNNQKETDQTDLKASNHTIVENPTGHDGPAKKGPPTKENPKHEMGTKSSSTKDTDAALASGAPKDCEKGSSAAKDADSARGASDAKAKTGDNAMVVEKSDDVKPKESGNTLTTDKHEKKEEVAGKADAAAKTADKPVEPTKVDKEMSKDKEDKEMSKDNERPKVSFGAVETVDIGEDDDEYKPDEDEGAEGDNDDEDGEIGEEDEPMLNLKSLPQSFTKSLLEKGAMKRPLHGLAAEGNTEELRALLAKGGEMEGNVDDPDVYRYTALHVAAENDKLEVCKLLLEHGADMEASTKMHESKPIHYAAIEGHDEVISLLLDKGANINALTDDNRTPLYQAAMRGHDHCVKLLLEKGADRNLADKDGKKPADVAGKREVIDLLISPTTKKVRRE